MLEAEAGRTRAHETGVVDRVEAGRSRIEEDDVVRAVDEEALADRDVRSRRPEATGELLAGASLAEPEYPLEPVDGVTDAPEGNDLLDA